MEHQPEFIDNFSSIKINSLQSLEEAIEHVRTKFQGIFPIWRGHANWRWPLRPEVFRPLSDGNPHDEVTLIRYFMAHAESRAPNCPSSDDRIGWLLLARHFGLPTRVLDWSFSPLVALYFAAQTDAADNGAAGCLWALEPGRMNLQMTKDSRRLMAPDEPQIKTLADIAFEPNPDRRKELTKPLASVAFAVGTREIDPRVFAQQGAFTIHSDATDLARAAYDYPGYQGTPPPWRCAFCIPVVDKKVLLDRLRDVGVHKMALFPDLASLAEELKSRRILSHKL